MVSLGSGETFGWSAKALCMWDKTGGQNNNGIRRGGKKEPQLNSPPSAYIKRVICALSIFMKHSQIPPRSRVLRMGVKGEGKKKQELKMIMGT